MALNDLKEKAKDLIPWNWGKEAVQVRDARNQSLPTLRSEFTRRFEDMFDSLFGRRLGDDLLGPFGGPSELLGTGWPRIDLEETDNEFKVTAEVPGMDADDVEVTINNRSLTIKGSKSTHREDHEKGYRMMETYSGLFHRTIPLPMEVQVGGVEAHCKNGQLTIMLPKTETGRESIKKIEIK
jgi:HSP20 family protein